MDPENKGAQRLKNWTSLTHAQKFEICIDILKKPFEERTEGDIALLIKSTEGISFFQELGKESHRDCCNYLTFSSAEKDDVIIKEGDVGTTFYIILQGSVGVYRCITQEVNGDVEKKAVPMPSLVLRDRTEPNSPGTPRSPKAGGVASLDKIEDQIIMGSEKPKVRNKFTAAASSMMFLSAMTRKKEEKVLTEQAVLKVGSSFGERALVSNTRRKATIIAKETTYFAVLEKKYFNQTIKEREMKIHNENISFLASLNYLKMLSYHAVEQVYYLSKKQKFNKSQPIYLEEDDPSDSIYIIRSGQFKILKTIEIKQEVDPLFTEPNSGGIKKKKPTRRNAEITILTPGELFGEFEVMENLPRESSIICDSSEAELYILSKSLFTTYIYSDSNAKLAIDKQRQVKSDQHKKRLRLIESQTNKNKNLLLHIENRQKPRFQQTYFPFSNSAFLDPIEKTETSFQKPLETEPHSEYFVRELNTLKDKPNSIFHKYKETMSYLNNLSPEKRDQIRMNSPKFSQTNSSLPTSKSTPKILIHSYDKRKRKSGSTVVSKTNLARNSVDVVSVRSPLTEQRKIKTQIITNVHSQNFFTTAQSSKPSILCLWDKDKSPSGESPMGIASIVLDKRESFTNRRPSFRTTPRARLSKDNSITGSLNEKISDSINMVVPKHIDSPLRVRESMSIDKDLGSPGSLSNSTTKLRFITNSPQGFMNRTVASFTQKIAAMSLDLQEVPSSPSLSSPYRKKALIRPLVKLNYQKGVGKIKDYMNYKLTGKV